MSVTRSYNVVTGWAKDGKSILFHSNRTGRYHIFRQSLDAENPEQLGQGSDEQRAPQMSPDGSWILYWSGIPGDVNPAPRKQLMRVSTGGGSPLTILEVPEGTPSDFSCPLAAGAACVLGKVENGRLVFYWLDPVQGLGAQAAAIQLTPDLDRTWNVSPDGSRVAVTESLQKPPATVRIVNLKGSKEKVVVSQTPLMRVRDTSWAADGKSLVAVGVIHPNAFIVHLDMDGKTQVLLAIGKDHLVLSPLLSPDGHHLVFTEHTWESNAWLLENF